jgi:hypothetical protein
MQKLHCMLLNKTLVAKTIKIDNACSMTSLERGVPSNTAMSWFQWNWRFVYPSPGYRVMASFNWLPKPFRDTWKISTRGMKNKPSNEIEFLTSCMCNWDRARWSRFPHPWLKHFSKSWPIMQNLHYMLLHKTLVVETVKKNNVQSTKSLERGVPSGTPMSWFQRNWRFVRPSLGFLLMASFNSLTKVIQGQLENFNGGIKNKPSNIIEFRFLLQVCLG